MKPKFYFLGIFKMSAFLLILGLVTGPVRAAFSPLATGWEYQASAAGFTLINAGNENADNILFDVDGTFTDMNPVTFTFKTTADKKQEFFWMGMNVLNNTGITWKGFKIQVVDKYDTDHVVDEVHPIWAHIHPEATHSGNPTDYSPFNTLSATGFNPVDTLIVSGGTLASGNIWGATNIRLHDKATAYPTAGVMEFDMILTPIPESSTYLAGALLLLPFGLQGLCSLRNRKQAA